MPERYSEPPDGWYGYTCEVCSREVHSEDPFYNAVDAMVCETCHEENLFYCDFCGDHKTGNIYQISTVIYRSNTILVDHICQDCYEETEDKTDIIQIV